MIGKFITIEGIDGSGKTTMINNLKYYFEKKGFDVVLTREPGGVEVSEKIREIIFLNDIDAKTEALLFAASRREHILKKIIPELKQGKIILCDRFVDSSIAYQSYGRGLKEEDVKFINDYILDSLSPDVTLYFSVNVETSLARTKSREENNKMDNEKQDFYNKVKAGYDKIAQENKDRVITIDTNKNINIVKKELELIFEDLLKKWKLIN